MKSEFQISEDLGYRVNHWFDMHYTSLEMVKAFEQWKQTNCFTDSGKNRYRKGYIDSLFGFFMSLKNVVENNCVVFGYWYKDEFFTTHSKKSRHVIDNNLKTTDDLRDQYPDMACRVWSKIMVSGFYYADNLKPYFVKGD